MARRTDSRLRIAAYIGVSLATLGGLGIYALSTLNSPPTWSDLPFEWFERPASQDPSTWSLPGSSVVRLDLNGVRVKVVPETREDVVIEGSTTGSAGAKCPAQVSQNAPVVVVRTPLNVTIHTTGVFVADVGAAEGLMISNKGCGLWRVTGPHRRLWLAQEGAGRIEAAAGDEVRVFAKGLAVMRLDHVTRSLDAVLRGPGRLDVGRAEGAIDAQVWGRGRIGVASGFTSQARLFVKGPGRISHRGTVGALTAEARVGGKVQVAHVRGIATGSGDVEVAR